MTRLIAISGLALAILAVVGCSSPSISVYENREPKLVPEEFFEGRLEAHGVVTNFRGKVIRHFNATIDAHWRDGVGTLEEKFIFDDGEEQQRTWKLVPAGDGGYVATAGDVVGEGRLTSAGNAMFLKYKLEIPWNDSTLILGIDDRMYLVNDRVLINESSMRKWGFEVGRILLTMVKTGNEGGDLSE